jgi:hypothetical protein
VAWCSSYLINIPIAGLLMAIATGGLRRVIPEAYAFGLGVLILGIGLYPLNRAFARPEGRKRRFLRVFLASLVGGAVGAVFWHLLP